MPGRTGLSLSPGEWAVLGVLAEGPTHGFAVAQLLAPNGPLGRIWSIPRPLVYQALKKLQAADLVAQQDTERSDRGPQRTIIDLTAGGRRAVEEWLHRPVEHVRDMRSLFLLKLALLDRAGADPTDLVVGQHALLQATVGTLAQQLQRADGFDRVLATWRLETTLASLRFLETLAALPSAG